jgi:small conductance mechanosensitive channel
VKERTMKIEELSRQAAEWLSISGPRLLLIIVLTVAGLAAVRVVTHRVYANLRSREGADPDEAERRAKTLSSLTRYILRVTVLVIAAIMFLGQLGIQIGPVLAAAGVVGVAVGFGAQHLVQDVISGLFIVLEEQIRVGDVVEVAGKAGVVERVTIRVTVLRDLSGNVHFVRNSQIGVVTNMTKEFSFALFDVGVAYRENVDEIMGVLRELGEEMRQDETFGRSILEPIEILGLDRFADSSVVVRARLKTRPLKRWEVSREFNRRLKRRFDEMGIEIPFPHLTVYAGQDKQGTAAPLRVAVQSRS